MFRDCHHVGLLFLLSSNLIIGIQNNPHNPAEQLSTVKPLIKNTHTCAELVDIINLIKKQYHHAIYITERTYWDRPLSDFHYESHKNLAHIFLYSMNARIQAYFLASLFHKLNYIQALEKRIIENKPHTYAHYMIKRALLGINPFLNNIGKKVDYTADRNFLLNSQCLKQWKHVVHQNLDYLQTMVNCLPAQIPKYNNLSNIYNIIFLIYYEKPVTTKINLIYTCYNREMTKGRNLFPLHAALKKELGESPDIIKNLRTRIFQEYNLTTISINRPQNQKQIIE